MSEPNQQVQGGGIRSPDLSILIVTYHSAETIDACLESVISDVSGLSTEIIIVDNHSQDETPGLLAELEQRVANLHLIMNRSNRGFALANNQALEKASGEHILILNPDTVVHPGCIPGLLQALLSNEKIAVTAPQMVFPDGRVQKTCRRFPTHGDVIYNSFGLARMFPQSQRFNAWKMGDFDHASAREVDQPAGAALMVRGDVLRSLNGFDVNFPMFFNDVDLCKRIREQGYAIWFLPEFVMTHIGGASVKQVKLKMAVSSHVSFFRYFEKHFTRVHQQPANFLIGALLYLGLIPRLIHLLLFQNPKNTERDTL